MSYVTSYVADLNGNLFAHTICPPSFVVVALIFLELRAPPYPVSEIVKKAWSE